MNASSQWARVKLLTAAEESLAARLRDWGGITSVRARNVLVARNIPLAIHMAKMHRRPWMSYEDAESASFEGLMTAAIKFGPGRGRFSTYASIWIRNMIQAEATASASMIHLPSNVARVMSSLSRGSVDRESLGDSMKERLAYASAAMRVSTPGNSPAADFDPLDDAAARGAEGDEFEGVRRPVADLLAVLSVRERQVVGLRLGIDPRGPMTLQAVGELVGVGKERVRQIEREAIRKIRKSVAVA